ncbi:MAG: hypothetical protein AB1458_14745 [Bacteroidota bacterium]
MALNPNHAFEELDGVKCSIVEKNCTPERVEFLKTLLEFNGFTVVVVKGPPPKAPAKPAAAVNPEIPAETPPPPPDTFIVGVTDLSFDPITAVFNRQLKTPGGKIVSSAYWKQRESSPREDWYWKK